MPLTGHVLTAAEEMRGFDVNAVVSPPAAKAFRAHGYQFCLRYIRRKGFNDYDLTATEARRLLNADLALMPVQHVEQSEKPWVPTPQKGTSYGKVAAEECLQIGIPAGVTVWCDLEMVEPGTPAQDVIEYCNRWHAAVAGAGYLPGLYVGYGAGMTPTKLYTDLRFTHYWGAYNLNKDKEPKVRGIQMKQRRRTEPDLVPGFDLKFQTDEVSTDALGSRPTVLAPDSWLG